METMSAKEEPAQTEEASAKNACLSPHAFEAASLLKTLGHKGRLMILCHLSESEKSVTELQALLPASQALVSSHLARLRYEGLVAFRKDGKTNLYTLKDHKARQVLNLVNDIFCGGLGEGQESSQNKR